MYYLNDRRTADRRNGLPVQTDAAYGAEWAALSPEEKNKYKQRAQSRNAAANGHVAAAPAGALSANSVTGDQTEANGTVSQDDDVFEMVDALVTSDKTVAATRKVIIGSSNVIVKTNEGQYFPVEIGLVRYSLAEGVTAKYQQFTDPGDIPQGYMYKAKDHREKTHHIPENFDKAIGRRNRRKEFESLVDDMCIFMNDCLFQFRGRTYILIFTRDDMVEQMSGTMSYYITESQHNEMQRMWDEMRVRVVDISILLNRLFAATGIAMARPLCADIPNMSTYDFTPGSCDWHTADDNNHCAQGVCMRWCYLMSDCLLASYELEPIPGQHLPIVDQTGITVEDADEDGVWNVSRDAGRRNAGRPFMSAVNGESGRAAPSAAPAAAAANTGHSGRSSAAANDPRLRERDAPGVCRDSRNAVGRGFRRT
jgi:hypothetical protein